MSRQTMLQEMVEMGIDPLGDLRELGYEYRYGRLCQAASEEDKGFEFQGQEHFEQLSVAVNSYTALLLEEEAGLRPLWLPLGASPGEGCPIYASEDLEEFERILLVIQGSGNIRAGVWS